MKLDEYVKKAPEIYQVGNDYRLSKIAEFSFDDVLPPFNTFVMWEPPRKGFTYTVGVDPAWGIGEDRSVIHVNRNGTMHSSDCQVAEFVSDDTNMHDLAPICYMIGKLYEDKDEDLEALMAVECNISDDIVNDLRMKYHYNNQFVWKYYDNIKHMMSNKLGWWTTSRTRPKLINKAMHYIKHGWWDINSPWLISELETLEKREEHAQIKAASHFHDDMFMAGAIALWAAHDLEFGDFSDGNELAATRDKRADERFAAENYKLPPITERKDFQNTAMSYDRMINQGEDD